jgi:hypothetical protein
MRRIICTTAAALITITSANAECGGTGVGMETCGNFPKLYQQSPQTTENIYFAWAQGFLTGFNSMAIAENSGRDLASIPVD